MSDEIWVLGATGRTGAGIARRLRERGSTPVVVGRSRERLTATAGTSGARTVVAESPTEMAAAIRRERPAVVVNTVGPFRRTADEVTPAAISVGHYLDLANDLPTLLAHRGRDAEARRAEHTVVTGAGFGVTATESLLTWLTSGRPAAREVRVDMIPSIATTAGRVGEALAGSLLDGIPATPGGGRFQGRRIVDGMLSPAPLFGSPTPLVTPDGDHVTTSVVPLAELLAAQRASGAAFVESATSEAPSGAASVVARGLLPLMRLNPLRQLSTRLVARAKTPQRPAPRQHSWAHARATWSDGSVREGWLRWGDANEVTASVAAEVAARLAAGRGRPGAYTPAELFGAELTESCGGVYSLAARD